MFETLLDNLIIPGLLAILSGAVSYAVYLLKEGKKTNNANAKGTMLLLRRELINYHKRHCKDGEPLTTFDFNDITEIHEAYKALGGNGLTDRMFNDLMALDIKHGE